MMYKNDYEYEAALDRRDRQRAKSAIMSEWASLWNDCPASASKRDDKKAFWDWVQENGYNEYFES